MRVNITSKTQILLTPVVVIGALVGALFVSITFTSNANAARNAAEQFVENGSYGPCHEEYFSGPNFGNGFYDCGDGELDTYDQNIGATWAVANGGSKYGGDWFPSAADVLQGQDADIRIRIYSSAYGGGSGAIAITNGSIDIDDVCSDNIDIDDDDETILRGSKGVGKGWTTGADSSYASATVSIDSDDTADVGLHYVTACITGTFWSEQNGSEEQADREFPIFFNVLPSWTMKAGVSINKTTAAPGDTVTWTHTVENTEKGKTTDTGNYVVYRYQNVNSAGNATWDDGTRQDNAGLLRARASRNYCIDIDGGDTDDGSKIQLYGCNNSGAQTWVIEPSQNGRIRNTNSNKCLDVDNGSTKNGTKVQLYGCKNVDAQRWVYDSATGFIYYRNKDSGKCLDINNGSFSNGTKLQIYDCAETNAQKWLMDNAARDFDTAYVGLNQPGSSGNEGINAFSSLQKRTFTSTYKITQDDVGKKVCRRTAVNAHSRSDGGWVYSSVACVNVPYHYPGMCDDTKEDCGSLTPDCTQDGGCDGTILKSGVQPQTNTTQTSIKPGETANFTYRLSNDGLTKSLDLEYRAYAFILKSGSSIDSESLSNSQVYASFSAAACGGRGVASSDQRYCQNSIVSGTGIVIGSGAGAYPNLNTSYQVNSSSISTSNANWAVEPGDKVCSYLVVDKWSVNNDKAAVTVAASNISCVTVNRNPQLQIRGSDSWAGGTWTDVDGTEQTTSGGFAGRAQASDQRGSWSQYGLFVYQGSTSGFGSAGSTMKSSGLNTEACKLIFANTSCPTSTGAFYTSSSLTQNIQLPALAYSNNLKAKANNAADSSIKVLSTVSNKIDLASLTSGTYWVNNSDTNNILMATGSLKNGVNATIYIDGILEIQNNITTESTSFTELADVPSLTVVAKNIRVTSNVTYIYGTYIARDTFYSAYSATGTQSELLKDQGTYNSQLKIDGALTSRYSPRFLRTLGGGSTTSSTTVNGETHLNSMTASEIINYLPTTFLVPATSGSSGTTWITTKQTVLPARY